MKRVILLILFLSVSVWAQEITVIKPAAKELWVPGRQYWIQWTIQGSPQPATIRIVLRDASTASVVRVIVEEMSNSNGFLWTVPNDIPDGIRYVVRVRASDGSIRGDSAEFKIQKPQVRSDDRIRIGVIHPTTGDVWVKTQPQRIKWLRMGNMPDRVCITLLDQAGKNQVLKIADNAPNSNLFEWSIPENILEGKYRISIKAIGANVQGIGGEFKIVERLEIMERMPLKRVLVTSPPENQRYEFNGQFQLNWETDLGDVLRRANDMLYFSIDLVEWKGSAKIYSQFEHVKHDVFHKGGGKYGMRFGLSQSLPTGFYRLKVIPEREDGTVAGIAGLSAKFFYTRGTEKVEKIVNAKFNNRFSRRRVDYKNEVSPYDIYSNWRDVAHVGYHHQSAGGSYLGFILRSQLTFPIDWLKTQGRLLLKAYLKIKYGTGWSNNHDSSSEWGRLYYLTSAWSGKCIDTPGYLIGILPNTHKDIVLDVTQYVQNWFTGSEPNHGFILGSKYEAFRPGSNHFCVIYYEAVLIVELLQEK